MSEPATRPDGRTTVRDPRRPDAATDADAATDGGGRDATILSAGNGGNGGGGTGPPGDGFSGSDGFEPRPFGRYELLRPLGEGAMGAVYLARDAQLDRLVALKLPHVAVADDPQLRERFLREVRAAATLHHPHLCPVYDAGEEPDADGVPRLYLTMAHIDGRTLRDALADSRSPFRTPAGAARLIRQLADAMAHAHARGVIHRDLKPGNVMLDAEGRPSITDFGLARRGAGADGEVRLTRTDAVLGTPAYMSPEQIRGREVGPLTDLYALGVTLYELLTGRLPFDGSVAEVFGKVLHEDPRPPGELRPGVDPGLDAIWAKMTARDPADRFGSTAEARDALTAYLEGETAVTAGDTSVEPALPPSPSSEPPAAPGRAAWALPAGWAALAAAALLGAGLLAARDDRADPETPGGAGTVALAADRDAAPPIAGGTPIVEEIAEEAETIEAASTPDDGWIDLLAGDAPRRWGRNEHGAWTLRDGVLVAEPPAGEDRKHAQIWTQRFFGDCEIRAAVWAEPYTDFGLEVRHRNEFDRLDAEPPRATVKATVTRYTTERFVGAVHVFGTDGSHRFEKVPRDRLDRAAAARHRNGAPPGWEVLSIRIVGDRIATDANGVPGTSVDGLDAFPAGRLRLSARSNKNMPRTERDGPARVEVRDLRVRPLGPDGEPLGAEPAG